VRQLQRHLPLERAIGALGQPDCAHAAFAQRAEKTIRADALARLLLRGQRRRPRDEVGGFRAVGGRQQLRQQRRKVGVARRQAAQPVAARALVERQRRLQQPVQPVPVPSFQISHRGHRRPDKENNSR
jgi:hypothetical protein